MSKLRTKLRTKLKLNTVSESGMSIDMEIGKGSSLLGVILTIIEFIPMDLAKARIMINDKINDKSPIDSKGYGVSGKLWRDNSTGAQGYIVGLDVDDGCHGYMNLLNAEGDNISDNIIGVDLSCLTVVGEAEYHGYNSVR